MKFIINRDELLIPLQLVSGVVERRQTLPVLANALLIIENGKLRITGTDLEVEIQGIATPDAVQIEGSTTVPARKFLDICKSLPDGADIQFEVDGDRALLRSGRSRFTLSTLPATDFPNVEEGEHIASFSLPQSILRSLIERAAFSMAQQDVRYYLNGMLFEVSSDQLRVVATDGHRLAMASASQEGLTQASHQVIVPRKGVLELQRLLSDVDDEVQLHLGQSHIRVVGSSYTYTSKLVDGKFPDYARVLPRDTDNRLSASRDTLKQSFSRAAILSNEKYRGVRLQFEKGLLSIVANNPEQEQAEEELLVDYHGDSMEVGFNVSYLVDVLNNIKQDQVEIHLADANSSALICAVDDDSAIYVVMPMRL